MFQSMFRMINIISFQQITFQDVQIKLLLVALVQLKDITLSEVS